MHIGVDVNINAERIANEKREAALKDIKTQQALDKMKFEILNTRKPDLIYGYTEVLLGEKLNPFEDEAVNQARLEAAEQSMLARIEENNSKVTNVGETRQVVEPRNTPIEQRVRRIEKSIRN